MQQLLRKHPWFMLILFLLIWSTLAGCGFSVHACVLSLPPGVTA
jgi:hypothetical protein